MITDFLKASLACLARIAGRSVLALALVSSGAALADGDGERLGSASDHAGKEANPCGENPGLSFVRSFDFVPGTTWSFHYDTSTGQVSIALTGPRKTSEDLVLDSGSLAGFVDGYEILVVSAASTAIEAGEIEAVNTTWKYSICVRAGPPHNTMKPERTQLTH
jgi:hypothetical protein